MMGKKAVPRRKPNSGLMKMSGLAEASDLPVSTIKFYLSRGLLPRPKGARPNAACYDEGFLERLLTVKKMRSEKLRVESIKKILDSYPFEKVSDWEDFRKNARAKDISELEEVERLAVLSYEERRKESILDSALDAFSTNGFYNTSVEEIAAKAGVSKGTCYQYFPGKEDLFLAAADRSVEQLIRKVESATAGVDGLVERLGVESLIFVSEYRKLLFMFFGIFSEMLGGKPRYREKAREVYRLLAEFIANEIQGGIDDKAIRQVDALTVAYAMMGIGIIAAHRDVFDDDFEPMEFFTGLADFFEHGLGSDLSLER